LRFGGIRSQHDRAAGGVRDQANSGRQIGLTTNSAPSQRGATGVLVQPVPTPIIALLENLARCSDRRGASGVVMVISIAVIPLRSTLDNGSTCAADWARTAAMSWIVRTK
jgi:hypothetical protein